MTQWNLTAAIRHNLTSCGADVPHDEMQVAALTNKLAGFDGSGSASSHRPALLPERPYDYDLPRQAPEGLVLVKSVAVGNIFNHRQPARSSACLESTEGDGMLPLPPLPLRSSLTLSASSEPLRSTKQPLLARPLLHAVVAHPETPAKKMRVSAWMPDAGCPCTDSAEHTRHVRKCRAWLCICKPPAGGRGGGDHSHLDACLRGRFQKHQTPWRKPQKGDKAQMIGEARRRGCPDRVSDGSAGGWVIDPAGRQLLHSAWVSDGQ